LKTRLLPILLLVASIAPCAALAGDLKVLGSNESLKQAAEAVSGRAFAEFYTRESNYNEIYEEVMDWYGTTRNGCVAFASTALRRMGFNVPQNGIYIGERVSLLTRPFAAYLQERLGWLRINDSRALQPGDLVFTVDEPSAPGYPAHVFMHSGYADSSRKISLAVDNQGFIHDRALAGDTRKDYSAFDFALRSPAE